MSQRIRDLVFHFFDAFAISADKPMVARTTIQAKRLLESYSEEEILQVISFHKSKKQFVYSFGFITSSIEDTLKRISANKPNIELQTQLAEHAMTQQTEVKVDESVASRNAAKSRQFGIQSRFGKKLNIDLLETSRQDN